MENKATENTLQEIPAAIPTAVFAMSLIIRMMVVPATSITILVTPTDPCSSLGCTARLSSGSLN